MVSAAVMAQVVSVNVVGFVNKSLPTGWVILVNPLDGGTNNTVGGILPAAGLAEGTTIFKWDAQNHTYGFTANISFGDWDPATAYTTSLSPGEGFWLYSPSAQTVTFVGEVKQGSLTTPISTGAWSLVGSQVPQQGALQGVLAFAPSDGDIIYTYNNPAGPSGPWGTASYSTDFGWDPSDPVIDIAQGLFVFRSTAGSDWTRSFTVAP